MKQQTADWNERLALQAGTMLTLGIALSIIALCIALGSHLRDGRHVFQTHLVVHAGMMPAPVVDDSFAIEIGKAGNTDMEIKTATEAATKKTQAALRSAVYTLPDLQSADSKHSQIRNIII
jgi:hypothetical protein